jgi:diaminopimelate decarboxylase
VHDRDPAARRRGGAARRRRLRRGAETALVAGVDADRTDLPRQQQVGEELDRALEVGVGRIVVDSFDEIERLEQVAAART